MGLNENDKIAEAASDRAGSATTPDKNKRKVKHWHGRGSGRNPRQETVDHVLLAHTLG